MENHHSLHPHQSKNIKPKCKKCQHATSIDGGLEAVEGFCLKEFRLDGEREVQKAFDVGLLAYTTPPCSQLFKTDDGLSVEATGNGDEVILANTAGVVEGQNGSN